MYILSQCCAKNQDKKSEMNFDRFDDNESVDLENSEVDKIGKIIDFDEITKQMNGLQNQIMLLQLRNEEKESEKGWETSFFRMVCICLLTWCTMVVYFKSVIHLQTKDAFINSIVPVIGFSLSSFSLRFLKKLWLRFK